MKNNISVFSRFIFVWMLIFTLTVPLSLLSCVSARQNNSASPQTAAKTAEHPQNGFSDSSALPLDSKPETTKNPQSEMLFNAAASIAGLPSLSGQSDETAEKQQAVSANSDPANIRSMQNGSQTLEHFSPTDTALNYGLSRGMGLINSAGENILANLSDNGQAKLNFLFDKDGNFFGEGDVFLPFWESPRFTFFTQLGLRSMEVADGEDKGSYRWIGNIGFGQRWFPFAESMDNAGSLMLGWNLFFDNDFTRSHQRGGAGLEAQYDWLYLAANYYAPLSDWKDSYDFDGNFVEERAAEGWDARVKAYLPFYRNLALTGAYSQWYGDNVAMYGSSDEREQDPRVWSYGLEYTPVPILSVFLNQHSTEHGNTDTDFGLQFTYRFGVPWEEQLKHDNVAKLRTVSGSKHEFVSRENRIILEYRAKNAARIQYLGPVPTAYNTFAFQASDGLGSPWAGKTVYVRSDKQLKSPTAVTDQDGRFTVTITDISSGPAVLYIRAGENEQQFTVTTASSGSLTLTASGEGGTFTSSQTIAVTAVLTINGQNVPLADGDVIWTVKSSSVANKSWNRAANMLNGLYWGKKAEASKAGEIDRSTMAGTAPTGAQAFLSDIVGERTVTLTAETTKANTVYTETVTVTFGRGPLAVFQTVPATQLNWYEAIAHCGGTGDINITGYQPSTNLPEADQLFAVGVRGDNPNAKGAAFAANWPNDGIYANTYNTWTGAAAPNSKVNSMNLNGGNVISPTPFSAPQNAVCIH